MKITIPAPSDRVVTYLVLLQSFIVVAGTLFVTGMLKLNPYPEDPGSQQLFVHHYGFTLLLLPMIWAALTLLVARSKMNIWSHRAIVCLGILAIPFGILYYLELGVAATYPRDVPRRGVQLFP